MLINILRRSALLRAPHLSPTPLPTPFISQPLHRTYSTAPTFLRIQHHLWTDASKHGYGAVLDPAADGQAALAASFVSQAEAAIRGCRGVFPPDNCYIYLKEAYAILLALDRFKELLRGTVVMVRTDNHGAEDLARRCLGEGPKGTRGSSTVNTSKWGEAKTQGGLQICRAIRKLLKAYDIEQEVEWTSGADNWLADRVSRAPGEEQRRHLPEGIRLRLLDDVSVKG